MVRPDPRLAWLVLPQALALAPHVLRLPPWVSLATALCLLWRFLPAGQRNSNLQRRLRWLLAAVGLAGVLLQHGTLLGPAAGVSLLVLMAGLKLLEVEDRRDRVIMVFVGYLLLMASLLHGQSLVGSAYLLVVAVVLTASLVAAQTSGRVPWPTHLRLGAGLVLQALPLAALLFVLFPRLPSPIGGLVHSESARTGLSDTMSPGSVSQLIQSDAVAMRVDITSPGVDGRHLYWRGPVLAQYDGRTWQRGGVSQVGANAAGLGRKAVYRVTLEPHEQHWLPLAGLATRPPIPDARVTRDLEWLSPQRVESRLRYTVSAYLDYRLETQLAPGLRAQALALPPGYNPRAVALGRWWSAAAASSQEVVDRALALFRTESFYYTLAPPLLGNDAVDDFLFGTRRGFCEHYASAFTVLMRAAGIPARVVTGYQGGEYNPMGGYWIVRQRDAHAWSEVWLAGQGWTRVDPTAAVAPERIEEGLAAALPLAERSLLTVDAAWLRSAGLFWDTVNNRWNQWVMGYDYERQRRLLEELSPSLGTLRGMLWAMVGGSGLLLAGLLAWTFRSQQRGPRDQLARHYARFCARLAHIGIPRGGAEGPEAFGRRASRMRPDLATEITAISALYVRLRYAEATPQRLGELAARIRRFRPHTRPHRR